MPTVNPALCLRYPVRFLSFSFPTSTGADAAAAAASPFPFPAGAGFPLAALSGGALLALLLECRRWCEGRVARHRVVCCAADEAALAGLAEEAKAAVARGAARESLVVNIAREQRC